MVMIKAVIFDVGGVLVRTEDPAPRRRLEEQLGLQPGEAEYLVYNSEMGQQAQRGEIAAAELWGWLQTRLGCDDAALTAFRQQFWGGDRLNAPLLALVRRLRPHYQTAIISNAMDDLLQTLTVTYSIADAFDLIVGSAAEKIMKPAPEIYLRALARLGRTPEAAIFIDDFAHNVAGARAVGMAAIHYTPQIDMAAALADYGVIL
ncbi:HAD family phosphatase [Caldilinea sp.]|uniref:HAD family hydrolase n=1 Tax=Caldilinea sp. TaxID=2293560 RepID=UPI002CAADEE3|nr:HAD family phosphatase [Anaerolineales bacterium]HQY90518.1 HAD family phosphatase [Caldilinea sp.]HRA66255.1 HAD family phosphatase [Caldilinea sp.]